MLNNLYMLFSRKLKSKVSVVKTSNFDTSGAVWQCGPEKCLIQG